jgi:hypothetical protein
VASGKEGNLRTLAGWCEGATYDFSIDDVVVDIDNIVIAIPAGSFIQKGNNESYH